MARAAPAPALKWAIVATASLIVLIWFHTRRKEAVTKAHAAHTVKRDNVTEVLGIGRHSSTVIFLHGLGGRVAQMYELNDGVFAALIRFDMIELVVPKNPPMPKHEAEEDMHASVKRVHELIEDEIAKGIDPDRIVISGFSQGCAISLLTALSTPHKLGGVMCLSGWLPMAYKIKNKKHPMQTDHAAEVPVFWGHGTSDNTIQYNWGEESVAYLSQLGFKDVDFRTYSGPFWLTHWIEEFQYDDMLEWLKKRIPPI
ncbi:hypothetical protein C6P46_001782 [Rhodotorula mucilaginosa]|uniref:Acyl-protein thioesterase 1 n=1 Tax=Rhodotorula mucilaginosa TaxID=5537 RepID=A0A9P7B288_RHOMI|nr:hypothetical protein C6P46_001782 [Rhodotorula mucilaginosa]